MLRSEFLIGDFRLCFQVRPRAERATTGVLLRRSPLGMSGSVDRYRVRLGGATWGKVDRGDDRTTLRNDVTSCFVVPDDWSDGEVVAVENQIRVYFNGNLALNVDNFDESRSGTIAFDLGGQLGTDMRLKQVRYDLLDGGERQSMQQLKERNDDT